MITQGSETGSLLAQTFDRLNIRHDRLRLATHALQVAHNKTLRALRCKSALVHELIGEVNELRQALVRVGQEDAEKAIPTFVPPKPERVR